MSGVRGTTFRGLAVALLLTLAAWAPGIEAQKSSGVIENPAKAKAQNAGRVVVPKEVLTIRDEGRTDYYFKWPGNIRVAPNGAIFLSDENQFLQFDKDGKFVRNLYKKGQGPGEMGYFNGCLLTEKDIIVQAAQPDKLLWFDYGGKYLKESAIRNEGARFLRLLDLRDGVFYFTASQIPMTKGEPGVIDAGQDLAAMPESGDSPKTCATFMTKAFVVTSPGGQSRGMISLSYLNAVPFGPKTFALFHTSDYLLKIYDPGASSVVREFRRTYERVRKPPETDEQKKARVGINGVFYSAPEQKYLNDIDGVFAHGRELWVVTSTRDKAKGTLIDVFDGEGVYQDAFYIKLGESGLNALRSGWSSTLAGDYLFIVDKNEDETSVIRKYVLEK